MTLKGHAPVEVTANARRVVALLAARLAAWTAEDELEYVAEGGADAFEAVAREAAQATNSGAAGAALV